MFHFFLRHPSVTSIIQACSLVYVIAGKLHSLMGAGWCGRFENFKHSRTESDRVGMRTFAGWNGWQCNSFAVEPCTEQPLAVLRRVSYRR